MKHFAFVLAMLCAASSLYSQVVPEKEIATEPKNITVYLDGAQITRSKMLNLDAGKSKLIFTGLSTKIDTRSILVSSSEKVSVLAISTKVNNLNLSEDTPEILKVKGRLEVVEQEVKTLADERDALAIEKQMLIKNNAIGGQNTGVQITELKLAADFFRQRVKDINLRTTALVTEETKKGTEIASLRRELQELNANGRKVTSQIEILLMAANAGTFEVELKYLVTDAGWSPSYDLRAEDVGKPIELKYNAKLFNNTGVDWKEVKLHLSTANPTLSAAKPTLTPWFLNFGVVIQNRAYGAAEPQNSYSMTKQEAGDFEMDVPTQNNIINKGGQIFEEVEISELSAEFDIPKTYSIPADAKPYIVEVTKHTLPATYKHFAAPSVDRDAFLLARVTGWENLNLVAGPANVYFGGTYLGRSYIYTSSVSDTLDLSFGRDKKVLVQREKLLQFCETKTIGSTRKESSVYEIVVKNNRAGTINLELVDQVPVSRIGEITVDVTEISGALKNETDGQLTWQITLLAGESQSKRLAYSIKYPKNQSIENRVKSRKAYAPRW